MSRGSSAEPVFSEPLPDRAEAGHLLTDRELSLYQSLLSLYRDHKVFVQVALSRLIEVDRNRPEGQSIRARYQQLVADFVLCRADLSVVAVIELDDRGHDHPRNQFADARKNKALKDARIRLVRIPAGALPSEERISKLIDARGAATKGSLPPTVLRLAETADTHEEGAPLARHDHGASATSRAGRALVLKVALCGILAGAWFIYSHFIRPIP